MNVQGAFKATLDAAFQRDYHKREFPIERDAITYGYMLMMEQNLPLLPGWRAMLNLGYVQGVLVGKNVLTHEQIEDIDEHFLGKVEGADAPDETTEKSASPEGSTGSDEASASPQPESPEAKADPLPGAGASAPGKSPR